MRVAQIPAAKAAFQIVERPVPSPGRGQVRIKIQACGVCHSDAVTKEGAFPFITYPRIPGHEIAGVIDALGEDVITWKVGQRVGVGWVGGYCQVCNPCRRGEFSICLNQDIPGVTFDGGYADYIVVKANGLALIPDALKPEEAAPLMCAGITTFNALRHGGALPGDLVAVQGIGGLGHLGIQYANKMGFETVAIGRGEDKKDFVTKLGAHHYIDTNATKSVEALTKLGGAKTILATAPDSKSMSELIDGLVPGGTLLVVGAANEPIQASPVQLLFGRKQIIGWPSGTSMDSQDTLRFSALTGVRAMIETFELKDVAAAYDRMITSKVRFRAVIKMA